MIPDEPARAAIIRITGGMPTRDLASRGPFTIASSLIVMLQSYLIKRLIKYLLAEKLVNSAKNRKTSPGPGRGRPSANASQDVRKAILAAAEVRFAERGYAATSVREIAESAGVTPAMIHYYFGSKESLLRAVLETALQPLAQVIESMRLADTAAPEEITRRLMATVAKHPRLPFLVIREVMLPGGVMQAHFAEHLAPRLGGALPALLEREQAQGRIRDDLPPIVGALAVMALALFPFIVRPVAEQTLKLKLSGSGLKTFQDHFSAFVQRGFMK